MLEWNEIDDLAVKTAKVLAADAVEKVGNGHPGTAISLAPAAYLLFQKVMRHDPQDDRWVGRDRFILSVGHSSLTLYNQLFLGGFGLELNDIQSLRTWGSLTPGHPEYAHTKGVEITTGPLGQGLASATGFAMSTRFERELFDPATTDGTSPFDHFVYVIAGDGDMQEGVGAEAASLAGHHGLGNLIVIYDANQISIEDDTDISFSEDVAKRYQAYGWQTIEVNWRKETGYVEDVEALYEAVLAAKENKDQPTLITLRTIIGWPSPTKQDTGKIHGSKLGAEELAGLKQALGFDPEEHFAVAEEVLSHTRQLAQRGKEERAAWQATFSNWQQANPDSAKLFERLASGELPADLTSSLPEFSSGEEIATRAASGKVINAIASKMPELWGGSADLAESNNTTIEGGGSFVPAKWQTKAWTPKPAGRILHFGIREHAMGAILNGISLSGHSRVFGGTFLVFSDYMRPSVRLAALMGIAPIYVWTHDSVALGEDGPTHQPIEHLNALRLIPNLDIVRPADANETSQAWLQVLKNKNNPAGIVLTRQGLPVLDRSEGFGQADQVSKGAYVYAGQADKPDLILIATGSEVQFAVEARQILEAEGKSVRVVSAPCLEWFDAQSKDYQESVLPKQVKARVSIEAGVTDGWRKYVGDNGESIGIDHFGASADYKTLYTEFGITTNKVVEAAKKVLGGN
ncbi:transketolase [Candidatus Aquiluna sp. IMCC13023]|uniref:transketolase n=1 Tax=Candidatus Aquiluna sp. IMCC13023 TaxID=1081644 RepID=UPI0002E4484F|nr:transketolase [Candidatus Aquiluna sp. IMCC13023]